MKTVSLLDELKFQENHAHTEALHADHNGRALRWALLPGQSIKPHNAPHTPVYLIVLQGTGTFAGDDGVEQQLGPNDLAIFAPGETHTIQAGTEALVFVTVLHEAPNPKHGH